MRQFAKPAIPVTAQVALLKRRGLEIQDESRAGLFLEAVSFFRLTPYMRPFQVSNDSEHGFRKGAAFRQLSRLYNFDRRLRLLVIDAIERIEVAVRAATSNYMGPVYGAHWYLKRELFKHQYQHDRLLSGIREVQAKALRQFRREEARIDSLRNAGLARKKELIERRARENYACHYALAYGEPSLMPGWAMLEELTLGELFFLFQGLAKDLDRKGIAVQLEVPAPLLKSWLHTLTSVRNICAHHARLWNRELGIKPELPRQPGFPGRDTCAIKRSIPVLVQC